MQQPLREATATSLLAQIDGVLANSPQAHRVDALRRITDLFLAHEPVLSPEQSALFDEVLRRLTENIESDARAELARRIAPCAGAPHDLVRRLALDPEISVAGPVLKDSPVLIDADLLAVVRARGQSHLQAIAGRAALSETITEVLVERGDRDVVRTVATNEGARLSRAAFRRLIARAKADEDLQESIGMRADLPEDIVPALIAQATDAVVRKLSAARDVVEAERVRRVAHDAADRMAAELIGCPELAPAFDEVSALRDAGRLTEATLRDYAQRRQQPHVLASLSMLCNLGLPVTRRLLMGDTSEPLLIVSKANSFSWMTVRQVLRARGEGGERAMAEAFDSYTKLTRETARRIVRFWQVRDGAAARSG